MIRLYTPNTGYPDLELKIAYGIARLLMESFYDAEINICRNHGFYEINAQLGKITYDEIESKINETFQILKARRISLKSLLQTPGFQGQTVEKFFKNDYLKKIHLEFKNYINPMLAKKNTEKDVCGHRGESFGAVIGLTTCTSYHHRRDAMQTQLKEDKKQRPSNPKKICTTCALLAILGEWFSALIFKCSNRSSDRYVLALPMPKANTSIVNEDLHQIFALQHFIRNTNISNRELQLREISIPLVLLSRYPSLATVLKKFDLLLSIITRRARTFKVESFIHIPLDSYIRFVEKSPYNVAVVKELINRNADSSLHELSQALRYSDINSLRYFARYYTSETSSENFTNLLPPATAEYLLKEVGKMSDLEIFSPEIRSVARTVRYFVMDKNYYYADEIRNAKDQTHLMEILGRMLRDAAKEKEKKENYIHLPSEEEVIKVVERAKTQEGLKKTKLALYVLAFSWEHSTRNMISK